MKVLLTLMMSVLSLPLLGAQAPAKMAHAHKSIASQSSWILNYIDTTPDFPKAGIKFKSYGRLLGEPAAFKKMIGEFAQRYHGAHIDAIAGLDARGFIFGTALAYELRLPFVLIRKAGKLPGNVERVDYALEYGTNSLEIDKGSLKPGQRVLIVDDLLATGGTAWAACTLVEKLGAEVAEVACMIELSPLNGRQKVGRPVFSLVTINVE